MTDTADPAERYKDTVLLPRADAFPMRAGLPTAEPGWLERWAQEGLDTLLAEAARERPHFLLHDGPPYANGNIHIGHAANKILKDVVNRAMRMRGHGVTYVPGWDCHGLPIEWKIEERYRAAGKDKDQVPILDFRAECRSFAEHWVKVQAEEFRRLGIQGDWDHPYTTMTPAAEARIVKEIHKFLLSGSLYQGVKPVLWSVVEKTALAEAEVEYEDYKSTMVWVRFPIRQASRAELNGADLVIWTTTPWTLPGNRAIAYGAAMTYGLYEVETVAQEARIAPGARLVLSTALAADVAAQAGITGWRLVESFAGADLAGTIARHPLHAQGYGFDVPALAGDFVTEEQGTGLVHIAPGHGADDFELGRIHGLEVPRTVAGDGVYYEHVPLFAGKAVYTAEGKTGDANGAVIKALFEANALLAKGNLRHQYPHSWRSRAPLMFRTTPQWFISMETGGLRQKALEAIDRTRFVPESGRNRLRSMVESRPDWCISRQRAWGVPIAIFVDRATGEPLRDEAVCQRIQQAFAEAGADAWFEGDPKRFLGKEHDPDRFDAVFDIVDVWFESGATHAFVLDEREGLHRPADLYLEGSDQHRGWFQSSLLEACGTIGEAPYKAVLTHGFVLDEHGRKMSKSAGNVTAPQEVVESLGADILRLWTVAADYGEDVRIGKDILKTQTDMYRRLRNSLRWLIGALDGFTEAERLSLEAMPDLERWVLHRLAVLDGAVQAAIEAYDFSRLITQLHHFCAVELSAFYFDIRKDSLYCDAPDSPRRRACRTVLDALFERLTTWLAPVLVFTAEEAWRARFGMATQSIHLRTFPATPAGWRDDALAARWERVRKLRRVVTGAIERAREEKKVKSSLQAHPVLYLDGGEADADATLLQDFDLPEVFITSAADVVRGIAPSDAYRLEDVPGAAAVIGLAAGERCARCWQVLPEVGTRSDHPALCGRCADAVG